MLARSHNVEFYSPASELDHVLALRPSVTGGDAWAIVNKVARGDVERPAAGEVRAARVAAAPDGRAIEASAVAFAVEPEANVLNAENVVGVIVIGLSSMP